MSKGYIKVSRELLQNYHNYGLSDEEFCFLLRLLSHKKGYVLTDEALEINRTKAYRLRKSLKEKGFINFYSIKNVGTKYYINISKIVEFTKDVEEKVEPVVIEEVISDFDLLIEDEKEYLISTVSSINNISIDKLYNYKKDTLDMLLRTYRSNNR